MFKFIGVSLAVVLALAFAGCGQAGQFASTSLTQVELSQPNYIIVATGVSGEAKASYLIGVTLSSGPVTNSVSLKRLSGTGKLYEEALDDLWAQFAAEHGAVEGRRLALTNVRYDADTNNFVLYSDVVLSVRADVIEFTDSVASLK